ncbi:MAG: molybdate ABC transporter permease subunit [Pseudomonadota bacterium]
MRFSPETLQAIVLSLQLASLSTGLLLVLSTPLAWWLAHTSSRWRAPLNAILTLPLVLPPTVIGFYLLIAFGAQGFIGKITLLLGLDSLAFSFGGLLLASLIYSLPFALQPLQHAFILVGKRPMEVAATLRASPLKAFFTVALPLARSGFITAGVLSFAHCIGEFGVVLMIGGNIPGKTRLVSTQIYAHVDAMEYTQAHWLAATMLVFSFCVLLALGLLNRRQAEQSA